MNSKYLQYRFFGRIVYLYWIVLLSVSCEKLIEIEPPAETITGGTAFSDSASAVASIYGLYGRVSSMDGVFYGGNQTVVMGLYSDELNVSNAGNAFYAFSVGKLDSRNGAVGPFWSYNYNIIYHANSILEQAEVSTGISSEMKKMIKGEALFVRALCHIYLVSAFGDVPIITSSDYKINSVITRSPHNKVYEQALSDLNEAVLLLPGNFNHANGQRVRVNKFAAEALIARINLYLGRWAIASASCDKIIQEKNFFELEVDPVNAFNANSKEAILQLFSDNQFSPYGLTGEGQKFIPVGSAPTYFFRNEFISSLDTNDLRFKKWIGSKIFGGSSYFYPFKYKLGPGAARPGVAIEQFYTILRLAEIFLIRAECRLKVGDLEGALEDVNVIRLRAGLQEIASSDAKEIFDEIIAQRKIELMAEQGHRWIDLKRWDIADSVNSVIKTDWEPFRKLFPVPFVELESNSRISQNEGY